MYEIKIYRSIRNGFKILGGSLFFVILGIDIIMTDPQNQWEGWLSVGFFGLLIPIALFQILDRKPAIVLTIDGITLMGRNNSHLEWQYINGVEIKNTTKWSKLICLYAKEGHSPNMIKSAFWKLIHYWDKNMGYGDLNISVNNLKTDPDRLLNLLITLINAKVADRKALIEDLAMEGAF